LPSSLSSPCVVCPPGSVASTAAVSALGAAPAWLGERGGGGMWILRWPFVVTSLSSLCRLCAMCDLDACPSPRRCCRASCNPQHPDVQPLLVRRTVALALSVRPAPFSPWSALSSPLAVHGVFPLTLISARCVPSRFSRQHSCCLCAGYCPRVASGGGGGRGPCPLAHSKAAGAGL
jgi:hypothetical protein